MIRCGLQYLNINRHYFICNVCIALCVLPYHHLIITQNGFCPAISSSILSSPHMYSTPLYFLFYSFPCFSILIVLESSMQFSQETLFLTGTMKYHIALPNLMHMHPQEMHPEHIRKPTGKGYNLRFQQ